MTKPTRPLLGFLLSFVCLSSVWAVDLKSCKEVYQKNTEEILQAFQPKFDSLQQQYLKSLETLKASAQNQGDLSKTKAAVAESARFQKAKSLPSKSDDAEIPEIKTLQASYVKQFSAWEQDMNAQLGALTAKYGQALDRLQKELVKAGKLDEATAVSEENNRVQTLNKGAVEPAGLTQPVQQQIMVSSQPELSAEAAARGKVRLTKALEEAKRDFIASNDRESAEWVSRLLATADQSTVSFANTLADVRYRLMSQMHLLVQRGALESAVILMNVRYSLNKIVKNDAPDAPIKPNSVRKGGSPGADGLVLYLPFDVSPLDGTTQDKSGAGNHGRVEGAQWIPDGRFGGAYQFRITNLTDRIVVPDSESLGVKYATVAAWIKSQDTDGFWNRIVDKEFRTGFALGLGGGDNKNSFRGKLCFDGNDSSLSSRNAIRDYNWHHVAFTYDGSLCTLYMDGTEVERNRVRRNGPLSLNHWDLCIGNTAVQYPFGTFSAFDGLIDEVRVYNRALSAGEMRALATATTADVSPAAPASGADGGGSKLTAAERIKQAKELLAQGLLTQEDYDKKVKAIVDSL